MTKHRLVSKKTIREVRALVRMHGVRMRCNKRVRRDEADCAAGVIYVTPQQIESDFISVAMHELQHIINTVNGSFPAYHGLRGVKKELRAIVLHGIQAEKFTDREARKLTKLFFPHIKFYAGYSHPATVWLFKNGHQMEVKLEYLKHYRRF
jgi:hypothetical protein